MELLRVDKHNNDASKIWKIHLTIYFKSVNVYKIYVHDMKSETEE